MIEDNAEACAVEFRASLPQFETYDDGRFRCLTLTLDDGRHIVVTDTGGMDYPIAGDWLACVYTSAAAFGDDPTDSIIGTASSDNLANIETAIRGLIRGRLG
jgi:hypothetical protein